MVIDIKKIMDRLGFVEQLRPYVADENALGRIRVDLHDLIEASEWLLDNISKKNNSIKTPDDLENFLIDIDVTYIQHVLFHIKSLRKDINKALKNFPIE